MPTTKENIQFLRELAHQHIISSDDAKRLNQIAEDLDRESRREPASQSKLITSVQEQQQRALRSPGPIPDSIQEIQSPSGSGPAGGFGTPTRKS